MIHDLRVQVKKRGGNGELKIDENSMEYYLGNTMRRSDFRTQWYLFLNRLIQYPLLP